MRVYAAEVCDIKEPDIGSLWFLLDRDRQKKVHAIKNQGERNRSIFVGLLLRYAFMQEGYNPSQWEQVEIEEGTYGKPQLRGYPDFQYSLSHSGEWCICAADVKPVGADIQEMRPWKLSLARRFYHKAEYDRLLEIQNNDEGDKRTREFYHMWTAKESAVKLSGRGLGAGIRNYVTDRDYGCIRTKEEDTGMRIRIYDELSGYVVCVCSEAGNFPEKIELIDSCRLCGRKGAE